MNGIILSHFQAQALLDARGKGLATTLVSLDLGITLVQVELDLGDVHLTPAQALRWEEVEAIANSPPPVMSLRTAQPNRYSSILN